MLFHLTFHHERQNRIYIIKTFARSWENKISHRVWVMQFNTMRKYFKVKDGTNKIYKMTKIDKVYQPNFAFEVDVHR